MFTMAEDTTQLPEVKKSSLRDLLAVEEKILEVPNGDKVEQIVFSLRKPTIGEQRALMGKYPKIMATGVEANTDSYRAGVEVAFNQIVSRTFEEELSFENFQLLPGELVLEILNLVNRKDEGEKKE